jgi:hypothetical protein
MSKEAHGDGTTAAIKGQRSVIFSLNVSVFFTPVRTGWSRLRVPVLRWSYELQSTL